MDAVIDFIKLRELVSLEAVDIFNGHTESDKVIRDKHIFAGVVGNRGFEVMVVSELFSDADESGFILVGVEVVEVDNGEDFIPREEFFISKVVSKGSESDKMMIFGIKSPGIIYNSHKKTLAEGEEMLKSIQEISNYIVKSKGSVLDGSRGEVMVTGGLLSLVSGYGYKEGEGWMRGILIDLVRESGVSSGLMVVLLYIGLKKKKQIVGEFQVRGREYVYSSKKEEVERLLNEQLDLLKGLGADGVTNVHIREGLGVSKVSMEYKEGYTVEGGDLRFPYGLNKEDEDKYEGGGIVEEGAVIWMLGEVSLYEYLDIEQVVEDFLKCEEFDGRRLIIMGSPLDVRRVFSEKQKQKNIKKEKRVLILELKGASVGGGPEDVKDIEAYTGASIIRGEYGYAYRVDISKAGGLLIEAYNEEKYIESTERRVYELKNELGSGSVYKDEGINKRISKLLGSLVVLNVGGVTEAEAKYNRGVVERKLKEVLEKRRSGVLNGEEVLRGLRYENEYLTEEEMLYLKGTELWEKEYSYEEIVVGLKRVQSLLETLNNVSLIIKGARK